MEAYDKETRAILSTPQPLMFLLFILFVLTFDHKDYGKAPKGRIKGERTTILSSRKVSRDRHPSIRYSSTETVPAAAESNQRTQQEISPRIREQSSTG